MSQECVERFLGRIITDERFRERARISLDQCCLRDGYCFSEAERARLNKLDFSLFSMVSASLDGDILRH